MMLLGFHSQLQNCSTLSCKRKWSGKGSYNFVLLCLESLPGKTQEKEWANAGSLQDSVSCWGHGGNGRNLLLNVLLQYHQTALHCLASTILWLFSFSLHLQQFTSSHLSTNSTSVQSIPNYVYSQLSNPQVTSPEAKKLHQEICTSSQRGMALPPLG